YIHGTFFWDKSKRFVLVQILNAIQTATQGERWKAPRVRISTGPQRLHVVGARMVWPTEGDLPVETETGRDQVIVSDPGVYTALYLQVA
ncbi:MAG: hypothetical protein M1423_06680, partial [Acidobacteria bacterium]|nr:hypothetical protein [Acidobacteriota bacterium]